MKDWFFKLSRKMIFAYLSSSVRRRYFKSFFWCLSMVMSLWWLCVFFLCLCKCFVMSLMCMVKLVICISFDFVSCSSRVNAVRFSASARLFMFFFDMLVLFRYFFINLGLILLDFWFKFSECWFDWFLAAFSAATDVVEIIDFV